MNGFYNGTPARPRDCPLSKDAQKQHLSSDSPIQVENKEPPGDDSADAGEPGSSSATCDPGHRSAQGVASGSPQQETPKG